MRNFKWRVPPTQGYDANRYVRVVEQGVFDLLDSLWALIPPYLAFGFPFQVFVMRGFFRLLPTELIEAARVDGASEASIFFRIMLPLSLPPIATLAIIDALVSCFALATAKTSVEKLQLSARVLSEKRY